MNKQLYIECTHTAESGMNTGIQRVVRKIINELSDSLPDGTKITLVKFHEDAFFPLARLPDLRIKQVVEAENNEDIVQQEPISRKSLIRSKIIAYVRRKRMDVIEKITWKPLRRFLSNPRTEFGLSAIICFIAAKSSATPSANKEDEIQSSADNEPPKAIVFTEKDTILLLDASWHLPIWKAVTQAKNSGATVITVIYDLIPITHPQFCVESLTAAFNKWFEQDQSMVDGYIAISQTVKESVKSHLSSMGTIIDNKNFGYFYLGADIAEQQENARENLKNSLSKQDSYLIVCTIEPRKNHQYLLDVFSELWEQGQKVKLHIVGHIGWKVSQLVKEIEEHPQFNKQLFMWNDLDDRELVYCYKHSKALIFPSIVEGFGLPIIEAQHFGLPVLASDTPIHREVGGESVLYFNLQEKQDLVQKIIAIEENNLALNKDSKFDLEQFTWKRSAETLIQEIKRIESGL